MAVTRIMAMHLNKGRTIAQCLKDRTDYAKNPGKTKSGELISAFGCDPRTADAEFLFAKRDVYKRQMRMEATNRIAERGYGIKKGVALRCVLLGKKSPDESPG